MARFNIPPITRILLITLLLQSILSFSVRYQSWPEKTTPPYFSLVPQLSLIYPWVFLTTTLVENNVFTLALAAVTLFYGGRYLERAWTSPEFAKFLVVVTLLPNFFTFGTLVILFAVTGSMHWTLLSINGTIPLQIAFLVAFSQLVPAHTVTLFRGIVSMRVPRFPLIHILAVTILSATLLSLASFLLVINGFMVSWIYLRFYKTAFPDLENSQPASLRGDASETFAIAEFFPDAVKPVIASISNQIYSVLVTLRICTPSSLSDGSASRGDILIQRGNPGGARAEAERKRARALKALDERLNAATAGAPKPQPSAPFAGPSIQVQPHSDQPAMLGETTYVPEREEEKSEH